MNTLRWEHERSDMDGDWVLREEAEQRIAGLEAELKRYRRIVPGTPATESEWYALVKRAEQAEARLDAVKKAATPDGCPMDEWDDGWNACCRSLLAALGGDDD